MLDIPPFATSDIVSYPYAVISAWEDEIVDDEARKEILRDRARAWRAAHPERAREIGRIAGKKARDAQAVLEGREPGRIGRVPVLTDEERRAKRKALDDIHNAIKKANAAERALAEDRAPGLIGRPPRLTAEEKEESRKKQGRRRSLRTKARIKAARAAKAISEGREPGQTGTRSKLMPEERKTARAIVFARHRAKDPDGFRARNTLCARLRREAIRNGTHVPAKRLTPEEKKAQGLADAANRRARVRAAPGRFNKTDIAALLAEQQGLCAICYEAFSADGYHVDHWQPLARGGSNDPSNLKLVHPKCNLRKGAQLPDQLPLRAALNAPASPDQKGD
jgi:5-methylcytosine-specific restriction endonuclease McrA